MHAIPSNSSPAIAIAEPRLDEPLWESQWQKRVLLVLVILTVIAALMLGVVPTYSVEIRFDPVTASQRTETLLFSVIPLGPTIEESPLAKRLQAMGRAKPPKWRLASETYYNLIAQPYCFGCGSMPLHYRMPWQAEYVKIATDAEILQFVQVMETGTEAQQEAAIKASFKRVHP